MKLKQLNYSEQADTPTHWRFDNFSIRNRTLIVGVNASGKSRIIRAIDHLAQLISKRLQLALFATHYQWRAEFTDDDGGNTYLYELEIKNRAVVKESFTKNGKPLLLRLPEKTSRIWSERENADVDFQTDESELAVVAKRDKIQYPFLDPLYSWGQSVYFYPFGTLLGQDMYMVNAPGQGGGTIDQFEHESRFAIPKFAFGTQKFSNDFVDTIKSDMKRLNYSIDEAILAAPAHMMPPTMGLVVKESDMDCAIEQGAMSSGMFRAFSLLAQVELSIRERKLGCLLVDDIGEGLDYERSCAIIDVLSDKSKQSGFQLVMATNDRFIMNHVPLEDWTVVRRQKRRARIHNYANSKAHFDEFKFTGLNNFDFLALNFLDETVEEPADQEQPA